MVFTERGVVGSGSMLLKSWGKPLIGPTYMGFVLVGFSVTAGLAVAGFSPVTVGLTVVDFPVDVGLTVALGFSVIFGSAAVGLPPVIASLGVAGSSTASASFGGRGSIFDSFTLAAILSLHSWIDISNTNSMAAVR